MAKRRRTRTTSAGCQCKRGKDGRMHCFKKTSKGIRGCKKR